MTTPAHHFHGHEGRVFPLDDVMVDCDPLMAACLADEMIADDWESGEGDFLDLDEWLSLTFRRWHAYQRGCQNTQRQLCWQLLIKQTYRGVN